MANTALDAIRAAIADAAKPKPPEDFYKLTLDREHWIECDCRMENDVVHGVIIRASDPGALNQKWRIPARLFFMAMTRESKDTLAGAQATWIKVRVATVKAPLNTKGSKYMPEITLLDHSNS